jgi:hypothetical protein
MGPETGIVGLALEPLAAQTALVDVSRPTRGAAGPPRRARSSRGQTACWRNAARHGWDGAELGRRKLDREARRETLARDLRTLHAIEPVAAGLAAGGADRVEEDVARARAAKRIGFDPAPAALIAKVHAESVDGREADGFQERGAENALAPKKSYRRPEDLLFGTEGCRGEGRKSSRALEPRKELSQHIPIRLEGR